MRLRAAISASLVLAGCGGVDRIWIAPPDLGTGRSVVLALHSEGRVRFSHVAAIEGGAIAGLPLVTPIEPGDTLEALVYDAPLGRLGLTPGPLELVPAGDGVPLPPAEATWSATLDGSALAWSRAFAPSPTIAALEVRVPCVELEWKEVLLPIAAQYSYWATVLDATRVLLKYSAGSFIVSLDGSFAPVDLPDSAGARGWQAGALGADGRVWLVHGDGSVLVGDLERGFVDGPPAIPLAANEMWVELSASPTPPVEIAMLGKRLRADGVDFSVQLFREGAWRELATRTRTSTTTPIATGLAWVGPSEIFVHGIEVPTALHVVNGEPRPVRLELMLGEEIRTIVFAPPFGIVVLTNANTLLEYRAGQFERVPRAPLVQMRAVAAIDQGLIFGGEDGLFLQLHQGRLCPPQRLAPESIVRLLPVGAGFLALPRLPTGAGSRVWVASRTLR